MIFNARLRRRGLGTPRGYAAPAPALSPTLEPPAGAVPIEGAAPAANHKQMMKQPGGGGGGGAGAAGWVSLVLAALTSESCHGAKSSLAPVVLELVTTLGVAKLLTVWLTWAGEAPGTHSRSRAATPPTAGAAIDVPDTACQAFGSVVDPQADTIALPGAKTSTQLP